MQTPISLHALLRQIRSTQSAGLQLSYILRYYIQEQFDMTDPDLQETIACYEEFASKQKETGKAGGSHPKSVAVGGGKKKVAGKIFNAPMFVPDYRSKKDCYLCHTIIIDPKDPDKPVAAFRWGQGDEKYHDYHPLCIPKEHREKFENAKGYAAWLMKSRVPIQSYNSDEDQ